MSVSYKKAVINYKYITNMEWDNEYKEPCKIIVVSTTLSVKDGFSHLPVLNYYVDPL